MKTPKYAPFTVVRLYSKWDGCNENWHVTYKNGGQYLLVNIEKAQSCHYTEKALDKAIENSKIYDSRLYKALTETE